MASPTPPIGHEGTPKLHISNSFSNIDSLNDLLGPYFSSHRLSGESSTMAQTPLSVVSKQSSSTMYQSAASVLPTAAKQMRSQYPIDPSKSHVEFILVASFDIDRGSIMEHQYPGSISGDENMLAELMLPDQVHNRSQDWTIFFLHKDSGSDEDDEDQASERRPRRQRRRKPPGVADDQGNYDNAAAEDAFASSEDEVDDEDDEEEDDLEGPPLIYVLNLVNTKHDSTVKRGAIVKAMAICTRHPFLHIYKPLLLLALDEYFKAPTQETLASLFNAVNEMDLSLMPRLSLDERNILQATASKNMFLEKFQRMIDQKQAEDARLGIADSPQKTTIDGPLVPSTRYALPRDTHDFESRIVYNGISVPVKIPTARSPETVGDFSMIQLIQTFAGPHAQSPQPFALHPHLTTGGQYTHPIIVLVNALLTQKRIIFLGHNRPSGDVAEAVLAACALASGGLLRGFTRHAFPYTDLTKIDDLLKVPGFIAGVTNPAFAHKPEWWDLLCDLPTGRMTISSQIAPPQTTEGMLSFQQQNPSALNPTNLQALQMQDATGDASFMESVLKNITNRLGEGVIRSMWRDWILKIIRISAAFEEAVYGASALYIGGEEADAGAFGIKGHGYVWSDETSRQRELAANVNRIEGWRNTRSYYSLIQDLANLYDSRPISSIDLHHHHDRLRSQKLTQEDSGLIYLAFANAVQSPGEICQLLTVTPESHGGLFYLSLGLLHPKREVRFKTADLLERISKHDAGQHFWNALGRFAKMAYLRNRREIEAAAKGESEDALERTTSLMEQASVSS